MFARAESETLTFYDFGGRDRVEPSDGVSLEDIGRMGGPHRADRRWQTQPRLVLKRSTPLLLLVHRSPRKDCCRQRHHQTEADTSQYCRP